MRQAVRTGSAIDSAKSLALAGCLTGMPVVSPIIPRPVTAHRHWLGTADFSESVGGNLKGPGRHWQCTSEPRHFRLRTEYSTSDSPPPAERHRDDRTLTFAFKFASLRVWTTGDNSATSMDLVRYGYPVVQDISSRFLI